MSTPASPARTRAVQLMVIGAVVAVLAPLGGFLGGSMLGPGPSDDDLDAMFVSMFVGLFIGGLGAALVLLGLTRWFSAARDGR